MPQRLSVPSADSNKTLFAAVLKNLHIQQYPAVIGISGAQGSGKSTLAAMLVAHYSALGVRSAAVSLDDYYLSGAQRAQLAALVHPLLRQRGVPGTHHIQQAINDVSAVLAGNVVALPRFDKALDEPVAAMPLQQLDLLIVEGWCLGLQAQTEAELASPCGDFEQQFDADGRLRHFVNQQLGACYQQLWPLLQPLIWLRAPDWSQICAWRLQQEQQLIARTGRGMNNEQLKHFMGSFERLSLAAFQQLGAVADITFKLSRQHEVVESALKDKGNTSTNIQG